MMSEHLRQKVVKGFKRGYACLAAAVTPAPTVALREALRRNTEAADALDAAVKEMLEQ